MFVYYYSQQSRKYDKSDASLLPPAYCLLPKTQEEVPHRIKNSYQYT
ncbi:MAG: hypothetical protein F6K56_07770 [Moorea sp. SIO3G5]|nr:hypothetical protein [Moorena sp. SIO3G5]